MTGLGLLLSTTGAKAAELYITVWEAILKLAGYKFEVDYVCIDGVSYNRTLQMMNFKYRDDAVSNSFSAFNPYWTPSTVTFIMDYSQIFKTFKETIFIPVFLLVDMTAKGVFNWKVILLDGITETKHLSGINSTIRLFLTQASKIRNHLAEGVLNSDMLNNIQQYRKSLTDGSYLEINGLLKLISKVIEASKV